MYISMKEYLHAILYVFGEDNVLHIRMIVPPFLDSKLFPFNCFFHVAYQTEDNEEWLNMQTKT